MTTIHKRTRAIATGLAIACAVIAGAQSREPEDRFETALYQALATHGGAIADSAGVAYAALAGRPVFTADRSLAGAVLRRLGEADAHGLLPRAYGLPGLRQRLADLPQADAAERARTEAAFAVALLCYARDVGRGRADPHDLEIPWDFPQRALALAEVIITAAATGDLAHLERVEPTQADYRDLRSALHRYERIVAEGGWPLLEPGPVVRPGEPFDATTRDALRARLAAEGYPVPRDAAADTNTIFTSALARSVREFQAAQGLRVDGILGPNTRAALNVPAHERQRQIELNLERWRWLPDTLPADRLVVNVPAYELTIYADDTAVHRMRVIVGREGWATPAFSREMQYIVFNPYWYVPRSIAVEEILLKAQADSTYLRDNGYRLFASWEAATPHDGPGDGEIDPRTIAWSAIDVDTLAVVLRKDPGPTNPLGYVKFMFPNEYAIYLHDTPAQGLFDQPQRAFSHGCIRVEDPFWLAAHLLRDAGWDEARVRREIADPARREVALPRPAPVFIIQFTAFVYPGDDRVQFRSDIYDIDGQTARALASVSPCLAP
jgi:L,D-transpeptidase YcbB